MPRPRSVNVAPLCVLSGTVKASSPSSVGIRDLAAQRERRVVQRDFAEQIVAVALEERMVLDVDDDVQVAGRSARRARLRLRRSGAGAGRWRCPRGCAR